MTGSDDRLALTRLFLRPGSTSSRRSFPAERQQPDLNRGTLHVFLGSPPLSSSSVFPPLGWGRVREGVFRIPAYRSNSQRLHARAQRADLTAPERALWAALRNHRFHGLSIRRKAPIGPWIADFVIPAHRIAICIQPETAGIGQDHPPPAALERLGYTILRPAASDLTGAALPLFLRHLSQRVTE